ncbi:tail tubular protein B [Bordetella phage vB_BbrP_BB8]|uniref:Tail tubular protein B n=1 Tax=Bordetella phage vB_BbrP_BB8 TaxID=2587820 RepID=A0A4Y5TR17_9CAUD|nr:tail tubular protein B [Bordetella phage vB_BbrP_BB8]
MPLVSSSIPNMVNGVSQQPVTLRLASQAELQENGLSTVAQGVKKRPPTRHIKRLGNPLTGSAYIHTINRDTAERYEVVITNGDLKVYDMDGNEKTVNFPDGKTYLNSADPATSFRAVTVADYTFILNRGVTVPKATNNTDARPYEALVVVKNGLYSHTYSIIYNGTAVAQYTTPDGTQAAHAAQISTDYIAEQLKAGLDASIGATYRDRAGSVIYISNTSNFNIRCEDGYNNAAMYEIKGKAQRFSDLPPNAYFTGFTIQVVGDVNTASDDYWVRYERANNASGIWRETVAPNISVGFNHASMPYGLVRESDGTFTFKILPWESRTVGDEDSAPDPSFVGKKIQDIFFYRNRLGILADESVVFSEAGEFFNFYPTTVTQLLDSDPIDVSASHTKVSILNYAVPFNKELLLFSAQTQFSVESGDILTPRSVSIKPTTEFECSTKVAPVGVGRNVYFVVPRGDFEGVREYFVATDTDTEDAADVTGHVPKYIPKGAYKIAAALNEDLLALLTTAERNAVYVYKFYWSNNEKLQSSWSRWVFPETDTILHAEFIQSELYLVINRPDGLYLERLSVAPGDIIDEEPYPVHLDRKVTLPASPGSFDGTYTNLTLGWSPDDGEYAAVVAAGQPKKAGVLLRVELDGSGNPRVKGDYSDCALIVGRRYTFRYKFSPPMIRTSSPQGQKADTIGRLQLRKMQVNFSETGYFQAKVTPYGRSTYTYIYAGKTLGVDSATIGRVGIEDGQFSFPIQSQNTTVDIELVSDSPLPCAFMSADWEGYYVRRSQSV